MANVDILIGQKLTLSIAPTLNDLDAPITGIPRWTAANLARVSIRPAADGRTCVVTGKTAGTSVVTAFVEAASSLSANHTMVVAAVGLADTLAITVNPHSE